MRWAVAAGVLGLLVGCHKSSRKDTCEDGMHDFIKGMQGATEGRVASRSAAEQAQARAFFDAKVRDAEKHYMDFCLHLSEADWECYKHGPDNEMRGCHRFNSDMLQKLVGQEPDQRDLCLEAADAVHDDGTEFMRICMDLGEPEARCLAGRTPAADPACAAARAKLGQHVPGQ